MENTDIKELHPLVLQLTNPEQRESALLVLSKKRENYPDLAPVLWHSYGTLAALLQEIISVYPMLSPPTLTPHASNRVCNALALLQCVASHSETKSKLLAGKKGLRNDEEFNSKCLTTTQIYYPLPHPYF